MTLVPSQLLASNGMVPQPHLQEIYRRTRPQHRSIILLKYPLEAVVIAQKITSTKHNLCLHKTEKSMSHTWDRGQCRQAGRQLAAEAHTLCCHETGSHTTQTPIIDEFAELVCSKKRPSNNCLS